MVLRTARRGGRVDDRYGQYAAVPYHPPISDADVRRARPAALGGRGDAVIAIAMQVFHMLLVLALAPLATGVVRKVKARLQGRIGPSLVQPYRDLARLMRKDAVLA